MSLWVTFGALTFQFLFPPFLCILALTLVLASLGKSLGVRRLYVQVLLRVFRFARFVTAEHHQRRDSQFKLGGDDDEVDGEDLRSETKDEWNKQPEILDSQTHAASNTTYSQPQNRDHEDSDGDNDGRLAEQVDSGVECASPMSSKSNPTLSDVEEVGSPSDSPTHGRSEPSIQSMRKALKTFGKESRHNVISRRDNLILSPDRPAVLTEEESTHHQSGLGLSTRLMKGENVSVATLQREFEMDDVLDYLKTGIAAIIEDEVTQRFVAEELKSWNLLTRTSLSFEFVNIKLTVIWVLGFFFRYFVLLPCRSIILVFGIFYLLFMTAAVGSIPSQYLRRRLYDYVAVTCFRILSRSFSAVVTFHNKHYRPKSDGICVANHTTPIDVVILQIDRSYALLSWLTISMCIVGQLRDSEFKSWLHDLVYKNCFQILSGAISAVITYHNPENKAKGGICVANHTSPIDVLILACDNAYALIGQAHGGFIGLFQTILESASHHIWFERAEYKDRLIVVQRLKEHVEDPNKLPILIFPEGTCINNTSVMQFKKGSFEVGGTIYPVAIKYDAQFGDAFWKSSQNGMLSYIYMMMTSWAIVCDVWYLPPMTRGEGEDAVHFANRVKAEIARQGGLVDLMWDGNLKRMQVKSEWKAIQQEDYLDFLAIHGVGNVVYGKNECRYMTGTQLGSDLAANDFDQLRSEHAGIFHFQEQDYAFFVANALSNTKRVCYDVKGLQDTVDFGAPKTYSIGIECSIGSP
ncbi:hypothetical protein TCAL_00082 [Tigriopus californicus]|uniref:Phospholipid/glycerol acyltransferase domain-containing protein n=1 Tax=Tigriopus californicus TaxID=6832 RepID=A0A553PHP2_TIGCA|nr:hypothetical protein TCAL_00082 [Tigriopus californicus]